MRTNMTPSPQIPSRTPEQLRNHYEVERRLADTLRRAPRAERPGIYARMYTELFAKVPDHPRLVRRDDARMTRWRTQRLLRLLGRVLDRTSSVLEFGAGDCTLAFAICEHVRSVCAVDISNQIGPDRVIPPNFRHVTYDGYRLAVPDASIDVVFSNDLIEHIHPDDIGLHFANANRVLHPGGVYLFTTPHRFTGPHDVSRAFSDEPEGFHLKEWTFTELEPVMREAGFSSWTFFRFAKGIPVRQSVFAIEQLERGIAPLANGLRRRLGRIFVPGIIVCASK
ncbi:MAG: class I SAM-dependent methyltransferase [Candidatus Binatia bacterium]